MNFEYSKFQHKYTYVKKEFHLRNFYLCDNFYISEIFEEVNYSWEEVELLNDLLLEYYDPNIKIGWVSNRINSHFIEPQSWIKFHEKYDFYVASAIVSYNDITYLNATIEKQFSNINIKRCSNSGRALDWITSLKEFN